MATFNFYDCYAGDAARGVHNLNTDTLKVALSNTAPNVATHTGLADITEIAAGNGYPAGGQDVQNTESSSGGVSDTVAVDHTFLAAGGSIGPFRYAHVYNDDVVGDPLIGYWDYGSSITLADGESLLVDHQAYLLRLTA